MKTNKHIKQSLEDVVTRGLPNGHSVEWSHYLRPDFKDRVELVLTEDRGEDWNYLIIGVWKNFNNTFILRLKEGR